MQTRLCLLALPAVFTCLAAWPSAPQPVADASQPPAFYHPHFRKVLECQISRGLTVTISYLTVTFDAKGAKKMKPGQAWHLAGATLETTADVLIGGQKVSAGKYALSVVKTEGEKWQLSLHQGQGFSRPGDDAQLLKTRSGASATLFEHMNIDVQPAGDKQHTRLHLDVRFDKLIASATIEVPKKEK